MFRIRRVALFTTLALVAAGCGEGSGGSPIFTAAPPAELPAAAAPAFVIVDEDPASPTSMTVGFAPNDQGVESLVILGDKLPFTQPPEGMLIYVEDQADPFDLTFDAQGRLLQVLAPDGAELRVLSYQDDEATVAAIGPDGTTEVVTVPAPGVDLSTFGSLDASAGQAGVNAVLTSYRTGEGVPPLGVVVATSSGTYSIQLPDGLNASDVFLRARGCSVPAIYGSYVTCSTSIGVDQVVVRSTVDVPGLYGGEIPRIFFDTRDRCELGGASTQAAGMLLLAGAVAVAVVSVVAAPVIGGVGGLVALLGGSASSLAATAMGGTLILIGQQPCTGAFTTNEGLRLDVAERLRGVSATVDFTPIVLKDPESYTAVVEPARLVFEPFGATGSDRLDPIIVSVVPIEDPGGSTTVTALDVGSIAGSVLDAVTSAPIAGAVVTVLPAGSTTVTDAAGQFAVAEVPAGTQTISVTADGFAEKTTLVEVQANEATPLTVTLDSAVLGVWTLSGIWKTGGGDADGTMTFTAGGGMTYSYGELWADGSFYSRAGSGAWSISGDTLVVSWPVLAGEMAYNGVHAGTFDARVPTVLLVSDNWNFTLSR